MGSVKTKKGQDTMQTTETNKSVTVLGQLELPALNSATDAAIAFVFGKENSKGKSAVTLTMKPLHNKAKTDLATATGLTGAALKAKGRVYSDQVAEWELATMTKLVASGEWTAAKRAARSSADGKTLCFSLKRVEAKTTPMSTEDMLGALGISAEQLALAKSIKVQKPVNVPVKAAAAPKQAGLAIKG
jgi:hypothetical protein